MKKLEEQKKRKEAERRLRREQRLADMQKKQLEQEEQHGPQQPQQPQQPQGAGAPKQSSSSRILESIEREEDKEARILAEAMTSVPEDEDEDPNDHIEEEEDMQSFTAAERRTKSKKRKNAHDVRYISLKPFWKKERKRGRQEAAEAAELESNGASAAQDDFDNQDDNDEDFVKASPVPLPDASLCKSILHRFGYNNTTPHKKNLRYADGVLPGAGSPDHHTNHAGSQPGGSPPPTHLAANR